MVAAGHILENVEAEVQCPHCGTWFSPDSVAFFRFRRKLRLMNLPAVRALPQTTQAIWCNDEFVSCLMDNVDLGITQLALVLPYSPGHIHAHMQRLIAAELLEPHYIGKKKRYKRYALHHAIAA